MFFFELLFRNPLQYLVALAVILFSVVLHNVVQALLANALGDSTPKANGFARTDPQVHVQPIQLLFLALFGFVFPNQIPLRTRYVRGRGGQEAFIWLSGPLAMLIWAFVLLIAVSVFARSLGSDLAVIVVGAFIGAFMVISLAVLFALPIPPLSGAMALAAVGGMEARRFLGTLESFMVRLYPFGFFLIYIILSYTGILGWITNRVLDGMNLLAGLFGLQIPRFM